MHQDLSDHIHYTYLLYVMYGFKIKFHIKLQTGSKVGDSKYSISFYTCE